MINIEKYKYYIRKYKYESILFLSVLMYIIAWSTITIERYYSLNAYVYDAGLFMQELYDVSYVHWTLNSFFLSFTLKGLKFIIFPISLFKSFPLLFVFQTIWVAAGSPILYYIALHKKLRKIDGILLSVSYLIFFPIAGANFFDIHNITFLPTLFLGAYYTMIIGNKRISIILFFLASIVKYPISLLVTIFSLSLILEYYLEEKLQKENKKDKSKLNFYVVILIMSLTIFLLRYIYFLFVFHLIVPGDSHITGFLGPKLSISDKLITLLVLFGPVLFLPFLSLKTLPFSIGYIFLMFYTGFWGYIYPDGITTMYFYQLEPFLILGVIEVLSGNTLLKYIHHSNYRKESDSNRNNRQTKSKAIHVQIYSIFIIILLLALFFQPYGPFNDDNTSTSFHLQNKTDVNLEEYREIEKLVSTVPSNNPYVVIQNGIPEFFPRAFNITGNPMETKGILEVPGVGGGLLYNLTYKNNEGHWKKLTIDYVIADPYNPTYYEALASPYNLSMYDLVKELYLSGQYGIYSEIGGMIVLKHYYNTTPSYYEPYEYKADGNLLTSNFINGHNVTVTDEHTIKNQWLQLWKTPPVAVSPGEYEVNITYSYTGKVNNNSIYNIIVSKSGNTINDSQYYYLTPSSLGVPNQTHILHLYSFVDNFTDAFTIFAQLQPNTYWNGTISVSSVLISQIGYAKHYEY